MIEISFHPKLENEPLNQSKSTIAQAQEPKPDALSPNLADLTWKTRKNLHSNASTGNSDQQGLYNLLEYIMQALLSFFSLKNCLPEKLEKFCDL